MKPENKHRIRQNWTFLVDNLEMDLLVEVCYQKQLVDMNDRERIKGEHSRPDRAIKFLEILMSKLKDSAYDVFLEALCDPNVRQDHIKRHLQETEVPETDEDSSQERLLEKILKDSLEEKRDNKCSVDTIVKAIRLSLRRQQKCLEARTAEILGLIQRIFPQMKQRKNRRKDVVAIMNCSVKQELLQYVDIYEDDEEDHGGISKPVPMEEVTVQQVAAVMRVQLEQEGQDVVLADRMEEEEIDGKSMIQLTEAHIEKLFPDLKMGKRIRMMNAVTGAIKELQKPADIVVREKKPNTPKKLETFRGFDIRPKATDVYEKGHILPEEQSRPGNLLEPIHKYSIVQNGDLSTLATETIHFAAACMNERVNGTIHFGVSGKYDPKSTSQAGEIIGLHVNKRQCEEAITDEIYNAFYPDQREMALKCIRDPVYVPVVDREAASPEDFVVEVDIVPRSEVVATEAFFLHPATGNHPVLLRYVDGAPCEVTGKEQMEFMKCKKEQTRLRSKTEKDARAQPMPGPDLHRKLHGLLTEGYDYDAADVFPVLFLSPFGNVSDDYLEENFHCVKSLDPLCVFDFSPPSVGSTGSQGLHATLESKQGQVYEVLTTDNFDKNKTDCKDGVDKLLESIAASSFRPWIFCNGYGPLEKEELKPVAWRGERGQGFKEAIRFYREQIPSEKARILIFLLSKNYDVLLGALEEIFVNFPNQWILMAESEKIAQDLMSEVVRRSYVEKQILEERCIIGMPWSHVNQSIMKICGYTSGGGCTLPSSTGSPCVMKDRDRNGLPDLEVLSMTQCMGEHFVKSGNVKEMEKKKRSVEEEFYRGKQVSWWNFYFLDHVLTRSGFDGLLETVKKRLNGNIPDDEKVAVVTLLHQPGAGGTTTARHILWELRNQFRCCAVKQISDPRQTCDQITNLRNFEEPDNPKPPLVLIDNEDEEKVFQLCSHMNEKARREARDSKGNQKVFCVLIICVRMTTFPMKKDLSKIGLMLGHDLQAEEVQWFRTKYENLEYKFERKQLDLHPKLLISFNILKENFNADYIKRTVGEFISEIKDFKEQRLLKFIALINCFDPDFQSIPLSAFNSIMCPAENKGKQPKPRLGQSRTTRGSVLWEASLSPALNVLLNRTAKRCMGGDIKAVRIINNVLSRDILNNLRQREEKTVSDVILELLHSDMFSRSSESSVQVQLVKIMKDVLKKRAPYKKGREKFSPIILEIGRVEGYDAAADVLKVGFDRFDDPMIAQQIARIYIHVSNWKAADEYARIAQDMKPKNSYLCDTHGQVYKQQLIGRWNECFETEEQLEGEKARAILDMAFKAVGIFRREQMLSDADCARGYNNCGFFSELRVIVTLLDCCRFLKAFKCDKGEMLHRFLVDEKYIPDCLAQDLGDEHIKQLKRLYHEYEKPMRRLEDEQIQLKEDSCYQYSPGYTNSIRDRHMFVHLQECLDSYFGEDTDEVPSGLSLENACEYRRRRVKRKGGNSLRSIYEIRDGTNAAEEFKAMHAILDRNVKTPFCNSFDLKTILNITIAQISKDKTYAQKIRLEEILDWTQQLYEKSKHDELPYLEAYLYLVMFNWPTEWRNQQRFEMFPCARIKDIIKEWKEAFQNNHPAQKGEEEGNKPDRRKGTTLFFLGQGERFDEIVFYSELQGFNRRHVGDSIWDSEVALKRLKHLRGTLKHGGGEMSVTLTSQQGSASKLIIPTSYPIKDHSLWQKSVRFVLGFCWSGPKAYSVTRDDSKLDLKNAHTPLNFTATKRNYDNAEKKHMSEQVVELFWNLYFDNQTKLEVVEKDIRLCSNWKRKKDLEQKKKKLEKDRETLLQKRTSVLQGPD